MAASDLRPLDSEPELEIPDASNHRKHRPTACPSNCTGKSRCTGQIWSPVCGERRGWIRL